MPRYAAFLRAVNLGASRRVSGAELRSHFEALGFGEVATFRTSGNVVFEADREPAAELTDRIEEALTEALGHEAAVFLRSGDEVRALAEHEPFDPAVVEASGGKLQVALLSARPPAATRDAVLALATAQDRLALGERELYWLPSAGVLDSPLDLEAIEGLLGSYTMRTMGTVEGLVTKYFGGAPSRQVPRE